MAHPLGGPPHRRQPKPRPPNPTTPGDLPRPIRRAVNNTTTGQWRSQIKDAASIDDRPDEVADRAVPGHWEGDLMIGSQQSQIAMVIERSSRYTCLVQVASRHATSVAEGLCR